jgi:hypothetical protein
MSFPLFLFVFPIVPFYPMPPPRPPSDHPLLNLVALRHCRSKPAGDCGKYFSLKTSHEWSEPCPASLLLPHKEIIYIGKARPQLTGLPIRPGSAHSFPSHQTDAVATFKTNSSPLAAAFLPWLQLSSPGSRFPSLAADFLPWQQFSFPGSRFYTSSI